MIHYSTVNALMYQKFTHSLTLNVLVTAPAWPAHPHWLAEFLTVLGTKIEHPELATVV